MSTTSKLNPTAKRDKKARRALIRDLHKRAKTLRGPDQLVALEFAAELEKVHNSSRLHGAVKQELFIRGAAQLAKLFAEASV